MAITKQAYLKLYNEKFIPVYSDLVAFLGDKPQQVLIEQENINGHLTVYLENPNSQLGKENLEKAYNHLIRITIDSSKILWIEIDQLLTQIKNDKERRVFTMNMPEDEFLANSKNFKLGPEKLVRLK